MAWSALDGLATRPDSGQTKREQPGRRTMHNAQYSSLPKLNYHVTCEWEGAHSSLVYY